MGSDSEEDGLEELEFDVEEDEDETGLLDAVEEATEDGEGEVDGDGEGEEESSGEDEEDDEDDEDEDEDEEDAPGSGGVVIDVEASSPTHPVIPPTTAPTNNVPAPPTVPPPVQPVRQRSLSPAARRRQALRYTIPRNALPPRSFTVEAVCALPHPSPIHSLASSFCMSHLLTGADDGYIRNYNIFAALNSKTFLSAPQRHHAGVVEGLMKAGQLHFWWENPVAPKASSELLVTGPGDEDASLAPVYSLAMHSDALWALAGSDTGHINLFTVRHEPGRLHHVMQGHKGPVSGLALDYDQKSFFSAGWDGDAIQWDLNTGQGARHFTAHGAQLATIALRPLSSSYSDSGTPGLARYDPNFFQASQQTQLPTEMTQESDYFSILNDSTSIAGTGTTAATSLASFLPDSSDAPADAPSKVENNNTEIPLQPQTADSDAKSDVSFDPLFDGDDVDVDEHNLDVVGTNPESMFATPPESKIAMPGSQNVTQPQPAPIAVPSAQTQILQTQPQPQFQLSRHAPSTVGPPKNAPPLLDPENYATFSPDLLLTASVDGQVILWDRRIHTPGKGVGRLWMNEKTPPWCLSACWSADGSQIYAGRRNGTVDVWDVRLLGRSGPTQTPRLVKTLRNPPSSGVVSCVVAFPDGRHIASASSDNLRLWNVAEAGEHDSSRISRGVQFKIIPGHHGGYVSQMLVDPGCRFLVSASSNRGWHGESTKTVFVHDIKSNM